MINVKQTKRFCKEDISKIKNYDKATADNTQVWHCHHMTETWWNCTRKELIENECYYNRKACELIFLTPEEHKSLHNKNKIVSEYTKQKISESQKGRTLSLETRRKMSDSHKGKTYRAHKTYTLFCKAFHEHYGISKRDDKKLYNKEYRFYKSHGKFSWK